MGRAGVGHRPLLACPVGVHPFGPRREIADASVEELDDIEAGGRSAARRRATLGVVGRAGDERGREQCGKVSKVGE
ncbi:hypothetical protein P8631_22370, partial [Guyparkeria sp. 1SP6A2]|nr:hypothetical protein [Guyparkeria sp. 1SP6A2]